MTLKIFDCHIHLFTPLVIENVSRKTEMVDFLKLRTKDAEKRTALESLETDMRAGGVGRGLLLPTANVAGVERVNRQYIHAAGRGWSLMTAGTLHPDFPKNREELEFFEENDVRVIKFCSFSQGFPLHGKSSLKMFEDIQDAGEAAGHLFSVVLDTFQQADHYFGASTTDITTPKGLADLADLFPGIRFIGAHMGGLGADTPDLMKNLTPRENLFLDTSNAAHTLDSETFVGLLKAHGPRHILFGTDWPWFRHEEEVKLISGLLDLADFSENEKQLVFHDNIAGLLRDVS